MPSRSLSAKSGAGGVPMFGVPQCHMTTSAFPLALVAGPVS
jgi:hypothetical protein